MKIGHPYKMYIDNRLIKGETTTTLTFDDGIYKYKNYKPRKCKNKFSNQSATK